MDGLANWELATCELYTGAAGVNRPPVAAAGADQYLADADESGDDEVTLDGSGSSDPDGTIDTYVWTEGETELATGANPTITLARGIHTITLTVTDDDGATATDEVTISVGDWEATGSMSIGRWNHTATLLPDGRVLVVGGFTARSDGVVSLIETCEVYDPETHSWSMTASLPQPTTDHAAVLLVDGKVLLAGGETTGGVPIATCALYDPTTGSWTSTASISDARTDPSLVLLDDGRALVIGGLRGGGGDAFSACEVYDPDAGTWAATGDLGQTRGVPVAARLPSGMVLVAGGGGGWPPGQPVGLVRTI